MCCIWYVSSPYADLHQSMSMNTFWFGQVLAPLIQTFVEKTHGYNRLVGIIDCHCVKKTFSYFLIYKISNFNVSYIFFILSDSKEF